MQHSAFSIHNETSPSAHDFVVSNLGTSQRVLAVGSNLEPLITELTNRGVEIQEMNPDLSFPTLSGALKKHVDTVLLINTLEYLPETKSIFRELSDHHVSFDRIIVSIPNLSNVEVIESLLCENLSFYEGGIINEHHQCFFTKDSFIRLVEGFGFRIQETQSIQSAHHNPEHVNEGVHSQGPHLQKILTHHPNAYTHYHCFVLRYAPDEPCTVWQPTENDLLSVVVRTIDGRIASLDRALFSLYSQNYHPLEAIVIYQGTQEQTTKDINALLRRYQEAGLRVRLFQNPTNEDDRSKNLNIGVSLSKGQYIAFLDDDDLVYPEHYQEIIAQLKQTQHAWGYSNVVRSEIKQDAFEEPYVIGRNYPFSRDGYSYLAHWHFNFIPIHSFVIDRTRIPEGFLNFDERLNRHEDYDMILRLASHYPPFYQPSATAEYRIRTDGSNSVLDGTSDNQMWQDKLFIWEQATALLDLKKQQLFPTAWLPQIWQLIASEKAQHQALVEELHQYQHAKRFVLVEKANTLLKRYSLVHKVLRFSLFKGWGLLKRLAAK